MAKKYFAFREILKKYKDVPGARAVAGVAEVRDMPGVPDLEFTTKIERRAYGEVRWGECAGLVLSWTSWWKTLDV